MLTGFAHVRPRKAPRYFIRLWCVFVLTGVSGICPAEALTYAIESVWAGEQVENARALLETHVAPALAREATPPASLLHLRRRAARKTGEAIQAMRSFGYYAGEITADIDTSVEPPLLRYTIAPGPQFGFEELAIKMEGEAAATPPALDALPIAKGAPAIAADILKVDAAVVQALREAGHPFAAITGKEVIVDHATHSVRLTLTVDPGPIAAFGETTVSGTEKVSPETVYRELPWKEGQRFDPALLSELQVRLYRTNLFSVVQVRTGFEVDPAGALPITVDVSERKHRTVALGLRYFTDDGGGARVEWEDRNIRGLGHRLRTALDFTTRRLGLTAAYEIPRFQRPDQRFALQFEAARERTDAYDSAYFGIAQRVERDLSERLTVGLGVGLRLSEVERDNQIDDRASFEFLYAPAFLDFDGSDDKLNPTRGYRIRAEFTPYLRISPLRDSFLQVKTVGTAYWPVGQNDRWVLASRVAVGFMGPGGLDEIPADLRFYSGGGGSVRGYGYQLAGPLDANDNPLGGRSLIEAAMEMRYRFSDTIGLAAFVDSGTVYNSVFPDFSEELRVGAGVGLRYYTPLGPFRFDVAMPLNARGADSSFQVYLSIGQAF